jgi:outer membrane protein assembly factor BamB
LPDNPSLLWSYKSEARTSSSPVVFRETAYWCDKRGRVYGIDGNGRLCFDYSFNTAVDATPMIQDSIMYIGRIDGFMSALSLSARDTLWNFETQGQIAASPNTGVFDGRQAVVFGSYDSYLYCVDRVSGREISRFESGYYINGAVAISKDRFISGGCDAWLRIIDGTARKAADSVKLDTYIPASAAVDGNTAYVADHSGNVYEITLDECRIAHVRKMLEATDNSESCVSVPAVSKTMLFVLAGDRKLYAVDRQTGKILWKYLQKGASGESSPTVCRDKLISCTKNGIVSLIDVNSGAPVWEYDTGEQISASPAVINGRFFVLTTKGTLFCFGRN